VISGGRAASLAERLGTADRVAVVAGGAGGLGRAISLELAAAGMRLVVCDRDRPALEALEAEVGPDALELAVVADVFDPAGVAGFFAAIDAADLAPDVVVDVAGGTFQAGFLESREGQWDALVRANLTQVMHVCQAAGRRMTGRGGSIVLLTTVEAHRAAPGYAAYGAAKAGVESLVRSLAVEFGPHRIRVNSIAPDYVPTEGIERLQREGVLEPMDDVGAATITPLPRVGRPEDIAGCALFLASELSAFVSGTTIVADGGALAAGRWMRPTDSHTWVNRLPSCPGQVVPPA
jgi:3-oxoacyl-[acyl-carrier protein] reductase